jgi:GTP cyclohydrolase I
MTITEPARSVTFAPEVDLLAAERAAADLMRALGMDTTEPSLERTPARVARAYADLLTPREFAMTTFPNDEAYDELVVVGNIPFTSICEHHLLPFTGTAAVGYLPGERILGLSKLARVVELFARRPQVQERMTKQIADWIDTALEPRGTGVVLTAEHSCMTMRGAQAKGSITTTSAHTGLIRTDQRTRSEFLALANSHG